MADNSTLETGSKALPKDLVITSQPDSLDKDKFTVVATGLKINSAYAFQFQYVFEDGELSEWSPGYTVFTSNQAALPKPKLTLADISYFQGILKVTWSGADFNNTAYGNGFSRILIYIRDNTEAIPTYRILGELTKPGTFQIAVPPRSHTVKLAAITVNGELSDFSDEFEIVPVLTPPATPTGLTAAWSGTDFTVSFTSDPSTTANQYLKEYLVTLTASDNQVKVFSLLPKSGSSQKFSLSLQENQAAFGAASQSFSGSIQTLDIYGNKGTATTFGSTAYVSALTTPTLTVSAITNGYSVTYPTQTSNTFQFISIEEVESSASTDPGSGYVGVARGSSNPLVVPTVNTNKRWVRARLFDTLNSSTGYSTAVAVTPLSPVTVDNEGPANVTSVTTSGGIDNLGTVGFNGFATISWPAVTGGGIRGYRIRYRPVTTPESPYSYVDSPGTGTSYRLTGLGVGLTYQIAVATYDEYNNTSTSYVSGSNVEITGDPYIADVVDVTGYFSAKANPSDTDSFKFGFGVDTGKRGLVFNANNYWYIDSDQTATLKVGGSTTNYIQWNGSSFVIDGDMRAKKGSFSGNVSIASGASIYSGTLTGNTVTATGDTGGSLSGAGYILNTSGLTFNSATVNGVTTIDATTGNFITKSANIGGWLINSTTNPDQIYKVSGTNVIKLDSSIGSIQSDGTGYTAGFGLPDANNIVFWAGSSRSVAPFRVYKDGTVIATQLTITGYATSSDLTTGLDGKISTGGAATDVNNNTTNISGNKIRTGVIQSNTWNGTVTNGSDYSTSGMTISLDNAGSITAKNFRIDESGNAFFKGTLAAGISIDAPVITGGSLNIGDLGGGQYNFTVTSLGALTAKSANITGTITSTNGSIGGWNIGTSSITGTSISLNSNGSILTGGTGNARVKIDGPGSSILFVDPSTESTVYGSIYTFNNGNELIIQRGNTVALGYAADTGYISVNPNGVIIGKTNSSGFSTVGLSISKVGTSSASMTFSGSVVSNSTGGSVASPAFRNISAGTGSKSTSDTDGLTGDIWIQYS